MSAKSSCSLIFVDVERLEATGVGGTSANSARRVVSWPTDEVPPGGRRCNDEVNYRNIKIRSQATPFGSYSDIHTADGHFRYGLATTCQLPPDDKSIELKLPTTFGAIDRKVGITDFASIACPADVPVLGLVTQLIIASRTRSVGATSPAVAFPQTAVIATHVRSCTMKIAGGVTLQRDELISCAATRRLLRATESDSRKH
jgi:hypothetical protein